ncbi:hypothetical protein MAL01_13545 [Leptospira noguchii]|uniref:hypothetical protein n=1 Tax=Leptospira noguchii TaxID=28182 RepID=UPI001FB81704|nr:hypothetical protein [Leptospira noguchii]UOG44418.1 hypothetical protein MAL01_13545 [Leptospira noguchii]
MPILREASLSFQGRVNSAKRFLWVALTQQNAFLNSASHSPWVVRQVALTQQNASYGSR